MAPGIVDGPIEGPSLLHPLRSIFYASGVNVERSANPDHDPARKTFDIFCHKMLLFWGVLNPTQTISGLSLAILSSSSRCSLGKSGRNGGVYVPTIFIPGYRFSRLLRNTVVTQDFTI